MWGYPVLLLYESKGDPHPIGFALTGQVFTRRHTKQTTISSSYTDGFWMPVHQAKPPSYTGDSPSFPRYSS